MTTSPDRMEALIRDAYALQADALEMLARHLMCTAAEKAWEATKRATAPERTAAAGAHLRRCPETSHGHVGDDTPGQQTGRILHQVHR